MSRWVIAFPCLMYLASIGAYLSSPRMTVMPKANADNIVMGILAICVPIIDGDQSLAGIWPTLPYLSISLSLNITLTLMIVVRLVLHGKSIRSATWSPGGASGLYKTIATMLIESSALFAVSSLLVIGPLAAKSPLADLFIKVFAQTQVRAFP